MGEDNSPDLVLGTAGHIDHGKSSLVLALTGTDPDRLREEKRRGITIELGFAHMRLADGTLLGIVDVPGHENFVRQMIAGATGIDLALLCIAADDGIMPQTEEHLAILELLAIPSIVVALTKIDLVDDEWVMLVEEEIRKRLLSSPYPLAPIVAVSSRTRQGLETLKTTLEQVTHTTSRTKMQQTIRLPIDRVFSIKGVGTIVTGTLWSGEVHEGSEVEVLPLGVTSRVRGIQIHGKPVRFALAGHRVALNLSAPSAHGIYAGDFLATPHSIQVTDHFDAHLSYLGSSARSRPLQSGTRVHIAHGTREVVGRVLFMGDKTTLNAGEHTFAQLRLDQPLALCWQDRFVIRSFSPVHVIGGGMVLRAHPKRTTTLTNDTLNLLKALCRSDTQSIVSAASKLIEAPLSADELSSRSGLDSALCQKHLEVLVKKGSMVALRSEATTYYVRKPLLQKLCASLQQELLIFHTKNPFDRGISKEALRQRCLPRANHAQCNAVLCYAQSQNLVTINAAEVSHPQAGAAAQVKEQEAENQLYRILVDATTTPPLLNALIEQSGLDTSLAHRALLSLRKQGLITQVSQSLYFDAAIIAQYQDTLHTCLSKGGASTAKLRDAMKTTRKYAIPLLEYFDTIGFTQRDGDERLLNC